jgi:hypothetical protein
MGCKTNFYFRFIQLTPGHFAKEDIISNPSPGIRMIGGLVIQQVASQNYLQPQTPQFLQFRFPTHPTNFFLANEGED